MRSSCVRNLAAVVVAFWSVSANSVEGFETPSTLRAEDLLPPHLLTGELFSVAPEVRNDGTTNHYTIHSPLGGREAAGRDALERTIQELRAQALLRETPKRNGAAVGFNQGIKSVAAAPYNKVKRVAFNPLYAIEAVPGEIADYAGRVATLGDLIKYGPRVFIRRSLGIDGARTYLARRLGVDPDTTDPALEAEINRVAWGLWMGGLGPRIGESYIDLEYDLSTEIGDLGDGNLGRAVDALRREVFPRTARKMLRKMDVPKATIQTFRAHPHLSGRMREGIAEALLTMKETEAREKFIEWANQIDDPEDARRAVRLAQVMALHHDTADSIHRIAAEGDQLYLEMESAESVVPILHDYLLWSEEAAREMDEAARLHTGMAPEKALSVWSLGEVSPRTREAIAANGHALRTEVDRDYPRFERPRKGLKGLEQRYEKRVEAPIKERLRSEGPRRLTLAPLEPNAR